VKCSETPKQLRGQGILKTTGVVERPVGLRKLGGM